MTAVTGFPPLAEINARVLVLGSMPGIKSLAVQQYYGHPRNAFWSIMATLFGIIELDDYQQKKDLLMANKIALWDVLACCDRAGSLDSAIDQTTMTANDFESFFKENQAISNVYFNGAAAEKIYKKIVMPKLSDDLDYLQYQRLPSTSPAYASMSVKKKTESWRVVRLLLIG